MVSRGSISGRGRQVAARPPLAALWAGWALILKLLAIPEPPDVPPAQITYLAHHATQPELRGPKIARDGEWYVRRPRSGRRGTVGA